VNAGETLVLFAAVVFMIAFSVRLLAPLGIVPLNKKAMDIITDLAFALLTATLLFMAYLLANSDLSYLYVWSNTSKDLDLAFKLSALWAGAQGSFLVWTWLMAFALMIERRWEKKRQLDPKFQDLAQTAMLGLIAAFMLIVLTTGLFASTVVDQANDGWRLVLFPNGLGLKLSLQTWEMALHPLFVFVGYAFCLVTFAASMAGMMTKEERWHTISLFWGRLAWISVTLGIGIGAMWAYYVIGWGGYWGWDPVETSSLLLWLVLTVFLHTQLRLARHKEYAVLSPALGMMTFSTALFATFVTRAGGLWASSVHSFGAATGPGVGERLWEMLSNNASVLGVFLLMLLSLFLAIALSWRRGIASRKPGKEEEGPFQINDSNSMLFAVVLLILTAAIMTLILFKNLDMSMGANYDEFNEKMTFLFVALMIALVICLIWRKVGAKIALYAGIGMVAMTVVSGAIGAMLGVNVLFSLSLPAFLLAALAASYRVLASRAKRSVKGSFRNVGPQLAHLGVALLLIGYIFSSFLQVFPAAGPSADLSIGSELKAGNYSIRLTNLTITNLPLSSGDQYNQSRTAKLDILQSGKVVQSGVTLTDLYLVNGPDVTKVSASVHIHETVAEDLYLSFDWQNATTAKMQMRVVPMINALWAGMGLLAIGLTMRLVAWPVAPRDQKGP